MPKSFYDYTPMEQLAIKQALYKSLASDVSTKDPDSLRSVVDDKVVEMYEATGAKSFDVRVEGVKVGTFSVTVSKEVPESVTKRFAVTNITALDEWARGEDARALWEAYMTSHDKEFARWYFDQTGELPDGCDLVELVTPAQPSRVKGTTIRIDPKKVADALGSGLPTALAGLLGGDEDA